MYSHPSSDLVLCINGHINPSISYTLLALYVELLNTLVKENAKANI